MHRPMGTGIREPIMPEPHPHAAKPGTGLSPALTPPAPDPHNPTPQGHTAGDFKRLFDAATFGAALVSLDGQLTYVNTRFAEMHGFKPDALFGKPLKMLQAAENHPEIDRLLRTLRRNGRFDTQEVLHLHRDGRRFPVLMSGLLLHDASDQPTALGATVIDLTERKALERQCRQAQQLETTARLAGTMANDFKQLLTASRLHLASGLERLPAGHSSRHDFEAVRTLTESALALTARLLAFASPPPPAPEAFCLETALQRLLPDINRLAGNKGNVHWLPGQSQHTLVADPDHFNRIVITLCRNAADALDENGQLTIESGEMLLEERLPHSRPALLPGDYAWLSVSDNGHGMGPEVKARLFEPLFTTRTARNGAGLGLPTVYAMVRNFGGGLTVYSEPRLGSCVKVYFPVSPKAADGGAHSMPPQSEEPPDKAGKTILLVEDEPIVLRLGARLLERMGHTVLPAGTPSEAIRIAGQGAGQIDLLITDVVLPEIDGRSLADRIQRLIPQVKIIFNSGYSLYAVEHFGIKSHDAPFIQKPFTSPELRKAIAQLFAASSTPTPGDAPHANL